MRRSLHDHFVELALYDLWANRMVLRSIDPLPQINDKLYRLVGHLALAKTLWLDRLEGVDTAGRSPWPPPIDAAQFVHLGPFAASLAQADVRMLAFTRDVPDLDRSIHYATSTGQQMTNAVAEILTHLTHHAMYHRGQLATLVRQLGGTPAVTDFVVWIREGRPAA